MTVAFYPPKAIDGTNQSNVPWSPKLRHPRTIRNGSRWYGRFYGKYQQGMKNYYRLISQVDAACREIVQDLDRQKLLQDTMVIFTTDNGYFHGEHGLAEKWYPYQESIRVPLIIYDPRYAIIQAKYS